MKHITGDVYTDLFIEWTIVMAITLALILAATAIERHIHRAKTHVRHEDLK